MSDSDDDVVSVVLDNGSDRIKAGFSAEDSVRAVFPSIVGTQESVLFERFDVSSCAVMSPALPALVASGRTCGLVVDSGNDVTTITPLHETEEWTLDDMKRSLCYISSDHPDVSSSESCHSRDYQMPHGDSITLAKEIYLAPECLFQPSLVDESGRLVHESIQSCDVSVRQDLYRSIILAGASSMFPGFTERLKNEVKDLVLNDTEVKVIAAPERRSSVWIGGSILTSLSFSQTM